MRQMYRRISKMRSVAQGMMVIMPRMNYYSLTCWLVDWVGGLVLLDWRRGRRRGIGRRTNTLAAQLSRKISCEGRMEYQAIS